MTRKDFELIAKAFSAMRPIALSESGQAQKSQWLYMCGEIALVLATTNPRFDRARFLAACGVQ